MWFEELDRTKFILKVAEITNILFRDIPIIAYDAASRDIDSVSYHNAPEIMTLV